MPLISLHNEQTNENLNIPIFRFMIYNWFFLSIDYIW